MSDRKEAAKLAAELVRGLVAELLAGLEQEIVALVVNRLSTLETKTAEPLPELHNGLMVTPDKKHQH